MSPSVGRSLEIHFPQQIPQVPAGERKQPRGKNSAKIPGTRTVQPKSTVFTSYHIRHYYTDMHIGEKILEHLTVDVFLSEI